MRRMRRLPLLAVLCVAGGLLLAYAVNLEPPEARGGQANARKADKLPSPQEVEKPEYAQRFWKTLHSRSYESWAPFPETPAGFYPGQEPHGALLKTFLNRVAAAKPQDPPHGSVIVKENYSPDKKLMAITIMQRIKGYDAEHHDWYWVKYTPDGQVARQGGMLLAGKVPGCINCHKAAEGNDYVFTNDR